MVVITPENNLQEEISLINEMLQRGLPLLHVRKPNLTFNELLFWIDKISYQHLDRLVIHIPTTVINNNKKVFKQYVDLINSIKAKYWHLSTYNCLLVNNYLSELPYLSTSVHNRTEFDQLSTHHKRAFLSPVFNSISKNNYHSTIDWKTEIANWKNPLVKKVALGGITEDKIEQIHQMNFDDFALLGGLWLRENPLKIFDLCYKKDQLLFQ